MRQSRRAAFLSGLVYPGLGQANNDERKKGLIVAVIVTVLVLIMLFSLISITIDITGWPTQFKLDAEAFAEIHRRAYGSNLALASGIVIVWLYSIVDAYRVGKRLDRSASSIPESRSAHSGGASSGGRSNGRGSDG